MPRIDLTESNDERLQPYRDLPISHSTHRSPRVVVEGRLLVERLARSRLAIESVVVDRDRLSLLPASLTADPLVPIYVLERAAIRNLVGFDFHRGVLACARRPEPSSLSALDPAPNATWLSLAVAGVENPENLGAILRSAAAFGVDEVLLGRGTVDPWARRVVRVSMGAVFTLRVRDSLELGSELARLEELGATIVGMVAEPDALPISELSSSRRTVLVLGREDKGIDPAILDRCRHRVTIPTSSEVDSLNVAAAAAVSLYAIRAARPS